MSLLSKFLSILALAVALSPLSACETLTATQVRVDPITPSSATIDIPDVIYGGGITNSFRDSVGG